MKKILLAGFIILIAAFVVTCDEAPIADEEVEYTDVVYSPDGSEVTIYLDGVKVPVTKAQRAVSRDLAMMAYDYLEVIFIAPIAAPTYPVKTIARTNWELGQPAGINGVRRDGSTNYSLLTNACLFAGKKSDRTLFGIGKIDPTTPTGTPTTTTIDGDTKSVTFKIRAIVTGLQGSGGTGTGAVTEDNDGAAARGVKFNSFVYNAVLVTHGGVPYPMFQLEEVATVTNNYVFSIVGNTTATPAAFDSFFAAALLIGPDDPPLAQRRTPRFLDKGAYREPKTLVNSKTTVEIGSTYTKTADAPFNKTVPLVFTTTGTGVTGIFSVYLQIPVYMVDNGTKTNSDGGTDFITWYIRTGYGSELYSIDDGVSSGGCALFSRGVEGTSDWLGIDWQWVAYP